MCVNTLLTCSYPHREPVASIIFDPAKKDSWKICDRTQPWGRLSCGALEVHHSISYARTTVSFNSLLKHTGNPDLISRQVVAPKSDAKVEPKFAGAGYMETAICEWCTAVLKLHAHKFKSVQDDATKMIEKLETAMDAAENLRDLDKNIAKMEATIETLKVDAWLERKKAMENAKV